MTEVAKTPGNLVSPQWLTVVTATFQYTLTTAAVTYLLGRFIDKFAGGLRPSKIEVLSNNTVLKVTFQGDRMLEALLEDKYEHAVDYALTEAKKDPKNGLETEHWILSDREYAAIFAG